MYRELLSQGAYDSTAEYDRLLAFAREEHEEELAKEEAMKEDYKRECLAKEKENLDEMDR